MVVRLRRTDYYGFLITDFPGCYGLALEYWFYGELAVIFEGGHQLHGCLVLDILVIGEKFSRQQMEQQHRLTIVYMILVITNQRFALIQGPLQTFLRSKQKNSITRIRYRFTHCRK